MISLLPSKKKYIYIYIHIYTNYRFSHDISPGETVLHHQESNHHHNSLPPSHQGRRPLDPHSPAPRQTEGQSTERRIEGNQQAKHNPQLYLNPAFASTSPAPWSRVSGKEEACILLAFEGFLIRCPCCMLLLN